MKKFNWTLICLLALLLWGCNDDIAYNEIDTSKENIRSSIRWYGSKNTETAQTNTRGSAQNMKLWAHNPIITVKFLNETEDVSLMEKIKTYAKEWEEYAGVEFKFVDKSENSLVRIGFDWNDNSWLTWSYTGNDAKVVVDQNSPTASFGGFNDGWMSEEEIKGDVLRLFGQVLGLEYEQRHMGWDTDWWKIKDGKYQAQKYWEDQFDGAFNLDWETIKTYVFDPLAATAGNHQTEEIDFESIMIWPNYTVRETVKRYANYELSAMDKQFIATLYPRKDVGRLPEYIRVNGKKYDVVRIGEYLWINNNLYGDGKEGYNITREDINTQLGYWGHKESDYPVDMKDVHRYFGQYFTPDYIFGTLADKSKTVICEENSTTPNQAWGIPSVNAFRQLFTMCGTGHDVEVRNALAARRYDNPAARSVIVPWTVPGSNTDFFDNGNTNRYGFNLMPGASVRLDSDSQPIEVQYLFWFAGMAAIDTDNDNRPMTASFAYVGQFRPRIRATLPHLQNVRFCRRLTDEELGYKLYIDKEQTNIIKLSLTEIPPSGYEELPNGSMRGTFVQHNLKGNILSMKDIKGIADLMVWYENR